MRIPDPDSIAPSSPSSASWTSAHNTSHETNTPPHSPSTSSPHTSPNESESKPRPISTSSTAPLSARSSAPLHTLSMRFSGEKGHPVHPRHFLKEFNIAMRNLGVVGDKEKMEAFEDYLVVDSPAEAWYAERMGVCGKDDEAVMTWRTFQDEFMARFPPDGKFDPQAVELQKIKSIKFRQSAAVSAFVMVKWVEETQPQESAPAPDDGNPSKTENPPKGTTNSTVKVMKLGGYKPIATEEIFLLSDYGVPENVKIQFSSRVWGVGEYNSVEDVWFIHDPRSTKGADFRQSGTAFRGWFNYTGKYEV